MPNKTLIGPSTGRPEGERVPINIHPDSRERLRNLLFEPEFRGVGYSEFFNRACEAAEQEIARFRETSANTDDPLFNALVETYEAGELL